MDPVEIIYVDDPRNAAVNDHRATSVPPAQTATRIGAPRAMVPATVSYPAPSYAPQPNYGPYYGPGNRQVLVANGAPWDTRRLFGNLTLGGALDLAAEGIAALWPLPAAPVPTGEVQTDVQNHVLYQTALATHTKRDERIRTLGTILKRMVG